MVRVVQGFVNKSVEDGTQQCGHYVDVSKAPLATFTLSHFPGNESLIYAWLFLQIRTAYETPFYLALVTIFMHSRLYCGAYAMLIPSLGIIPDAAPHRTSSYAAKLDA